MRNVPCNSDDVIDSRDIIERIEELENERQELVGAIDGAKDGLKAKIDSSRDLIDGLKAKIEEAKDALIEWDDENGEELTALMNLADEGANESSDWSYGETLIHEDYFTKYVRQLVEDIGDLPHNIPGYLVIDWEATAENLKADYSEIDFDGQTYYIRNS